jgi:outer membrane protein insertion porin family
MGACNNIRKIMKILKNFIFLIIFMLGTVHAKAEIIKEIIIKGNNRLNEETIKVYGNFQLNMNINEIKINKILNDLYSTNFFEDIKIDFNNGQLKINITEYPVINQLVLLGENSSRIKEAIKKNMKLKEKGSFVRSQLANDIEIIKKLYSTLGYNFIKIESKSKKIDKNNLDLLIEIDKGDITRISSISFIGDKKIRERRLLDVIASEEDKFWKIISRNTKFSQNLVDLDIRLLNNYYKSIGYYDVKIISNSAEINKEGNVDLIYTINAGQRYIFSKITTNLDPIFDKKIFLPLNKEYKKIIGEYYSPFKIKKLLEEIDILIEYNDLQFVEHNVEEILSGNTVEIKFNISEGERNLVERINIVGNNITNESVIRGELLIDEGDPFTNLNLEKSISRIKSRNIFNSVSSKVSEGGNPTLKIIEINVEEKPTGEISAGAGIGTDGGSFAINISENNWLGEGKKLTFGVEVDAESLRGQLNYSNPNYDFLGNSINYFISNQKNDKADQGYENTIVSSGINTRFEQFKDVYATLGLAATYDNLSTLSSASESLKKQEGEFSELSGSYGFIRDKRDRTFMPTAGSVISFDQTLPLFADKKSIANNISASYYKTLTENIVGATKFSFDVIKGLGDDDVRLSKRKVISGSKLRGFQKGKVGPVDGKDHIGGNYAASVNLEANLPNLLPESTKTDLGVFLDFGNVWGVDYDSTIDESSKIRSSTGVAASWISPLGPMTFILSTNLSKANTDETESFKFNLGTTF